MTNTTTATGTTVADLQAQLRALRSQRGYSYARAAELTAAIECAKKEAPTPPPARSPRTCCSKATVSYGCVCSYMTRCPEHGECHHGTHD